MPHGFTTQGFRNAQLFSKNPKQMRQNKHRQFGEQIGSWNVSTSKSRTEEECLTDYTDEVLRTRSGAIVQITHAPLRSSGSRGCARRGPIPSGDQAAPGGSVVAAGTLKQPYRVGLAESLARKTVGHRIDIKAIHAS
jgi:hypothetical protein